MAHERREGGLLPIGRFARATGLTVKDLRHYAEIGLVLPARVDERTGYRYYALAQIRTAAAIAGCGRSRCRSPRLRPHAGDPPPDRGHETYAGLEQAMEASALRPTGPARESYETNPEEELEPQKWVTEIVWPVE